MDLREKLIHSLQNLGVDHAIIPRVKFRLKESKDKKCGFKDVLLISLKGMSEGELEQLREEYLALVERESISFPLPERSKHLITRIGRKTYNYGFPLIPQFPKFRTRDWKIPSKKRLEAHLILSKKEKSHLETYLANILKRRRKTIGGFKWTGLQFTNGKLENNRTIKHGHNCTSWISTAPIGEDGEPLLELMGTERSNEIGTNPGWWNSWILSNSPEGRIPFVIYWDHAPLEKLKEKILSGELMPWDFRRM